MTENPPDFSTGQWQFLAALHLFDQPASIEVLGALAPLTPGPLFDLLRRSEELGWLQRLEGDRFELASGLPLYALEKFKKINTAERLSLMLDQFRRLDLGDRIGRTMLAHIYAEAGHDIEALEIEIELIIEAIKHNDFDAGLACLNKAEKRLPALVKNHEEGGRLAPAILQLSDRCFASGQGLIQSAAFLIAARDAAGRLGDQRSWAMANLHLGRLYYVGDRRVEALNLLAVGKEKVEELGDADIIDQAAEFLGLYYLMHGLFPDAARFFEGAIKVADFKSNDIFHPLSAIMFGLCEAYLGQFHRAVGRLDFFWHLARRRGQQGAAAVTRAVLGTVLLLIKRNQEALHHLKSARREAESVQNPLALYLANGGLAYYYFLEGNIKRTYDLLTESLVRTADSGIVRQYSSPWVLEMIFELEKNGFIVFPDHSFEDYFERAMIEPNIHIRGVALRLRAKGALDRGEDREAALKDLLLSQDYLLRAGDPVQLAKTRLELALLKLDEGRTEESRDLAQQARQGLSGYWEELFPDGLRFLLESRQPDKRNGDSPEEILRRFMEISEDLIPKPTRDEVLQQLVSAMNRFFMSERGGLFWFSGGSGKPELKATRNLAQSEVWSEAFRPNLALVFKSFRENRPLTSIPQAPDRISGGKVRAILCLPLKINGKVRGVLYFDNSYLDNCFDFAQGPLLNLLTQHLTSYVERIWEYGRMLEDAKKAAIDKPGRQEASNGREIISTSRAMARVLAQSDRTAKSGASVLISGETGVGKELLARWIHQRSHRNQGPFVVVDPTTIPENLVESELFGHEKGAFTGADRRKPGRLEMADGGTLFIDEVGEIPHHLQAKFLRVIQEKSFVRIGGHKNLYSDFRLLTATNRDLANEVSAGRFREDLYYRLNVLELTLPPLRERPEDIILLARHFLGIFTRKHNRPALALSPEDEDILKRYNWPGNIREMQNVMERAVLMSPEERLELNIAVEEQKDSLHPFEDLPDMDELQRRYISYVLQKTGGLVGGEKGAAALLGLKRTTLHSRMKKLGMD